MNRIKFIIYTTMLLLIGPPMFSQNSEAMKFKGKYQLDMQFIELVPQDGNNMIAIFSGDCELTTKMGKFNDKGILEIPFLGENQMQTMFIEKTGSQIKIWNSSNSPMMGLCNGSTLAGTYEQRE